MSKDARHATQAVRFVDVGCFVNVDQLTKELLTLICLIPNLIDGARCKRVEWG